MLIHHWIMGGLFFLVVALLFGVIFFTGRNLKIYSNTSIYLSKSGLAEDDFLYIIKLCKGWYRIFRAWACLYYSLPALSATASIITIYIASLDEHQNQDIVLYAIFSLVLTMMSLILSCGKKANITKVSFDKMQLMLQKYRLSKCSDEELIGCLYECERSVTEVFSQ